MKFLQKGNIVLIYITNILTFKENLLYLLLNIFPSFSDPQLYQTHPHRPILHYILYESPYSFFILVFDSFFSLVFYSFFFGLIFFQAKTHVLFH